MTRTLADEAAETIIDTRSRGMPPATRAVALGDIASLGLSVPDEQVCLPVLTLSQPAMSNNLGLINAYAAEYGLYLCAHGKTMMAPQLFRSILAGERTIGLCAATVQQATIMAESGAQNVMVANQIVGRSNIARFAEMIGEFPHVRFLQLIDSAAGLEQLVLHGAAGLAKGQVFEVLFDIGVAGGRTGLRDVHGVAELLGVLRAHVEAGAPLQLAGVSAYEGVVPGKGEAWQAAVDALFVRLRAAYTAALASGLMDGASVPILSAGGSSTFDMVARAFGSRAPKFSRQPQVWIRPGVAAVYDHVVYQERLGSMDDRKGFDIGGSPASAVAAFRPALALWAAIQSIPDGDVAIVAAGIRDFPTDAGYPVLLAHYRDGALVEDFSGQPIAMTAANDQHGYLPIPDASDMRVGDVLKFGISHPCTAFDKWPLIFCVNAQDQVVEVVRTYF